MRFADGRPLDPPAHVSGRPLIEWLDRMLELLHVYGSPALQADVARYRPLALELATAALADLGDPADPATADERRMAG
jgi:hypothetical protein